MEITGLAISLCSRTAVVHACLALFRWAAAVAYLFQGVAQVSFHNAMMFGAASAVVAWHKIGELLLSIARNILHLPVFKYVDDFFSTER